MENTQQQLVGCKYSKTPEPRVPPAFVRTKTWFCEQCEELEIEVKEVPEPTDKTRIFNRLLSIQSDYDILGMNIESLPNEIIFRIRMPDFDMGEIRAIQYKAQETGFIRVNELMQLQKAGFQRPGQVPPKPQPKDRRTLRERARQKMFIAEPSSI